MKVLLILAILATSRSAILRPSNLPLGFQYQNVKSNPFESSQTAINGGFFSTSTAAPIELNSAFVSSTPSPIGFSNEFQSSTVDGNGFESIVSSTPQPAIFSSTLDGINSEFISSTPAPAILNQNFNSFVLPNASGEFLLNNAFESIISSTPQPSIFSSTFNLDGLNNEFISSTPAPVVLNQGLNQFVTSNVGLPQFFSGNNAQLLNSLAQQTRDYDTVSIENTSGLPEVFFETQSQKPEVEKNVYFFAAPEEPEPAKPRVYFEEDKKNVNLVFIKAPAAPSLGTIEITPPKKESPEKTVVYVLVKKPEEHQNILVKSAPAVKPQKPEVVFIKYKNEEDAQQAITRVQAQQKVNIQNQQFGQEFLRSSQLFNIENAQQSIPKPLPEYITNGALLQQSVNPGFSSTTESTFSTLGNEVSQGRLQSLANLGLNYGQGFIQSQSLPKSEYISNGALLQQSIIPGFSTTTESTFSPLGNEVTQGSLQSLANLRLNYGQGFIQSQSLPKSEYISNGALLQQSIIPGFSTTTESTFSPLGNEVTQGSLQSLANLRLNDGQGFIQSQSLPKSEYISNGALLQQSINPGFSTTTESTLGSEVTQGPLVQLPLQSLANLDLNYGQGFVQSQSQPKSEYISNGALLQQSTIPSISTSTESPIESVVTQSTPFSNLGLNYGIRNLLYSTPRPQVEINAISNNDLDNYIAIGGRQSASEIIEQSTVSPVVESSSVSPCASSTQLPIRFSSTLSPSISSLNPFYKKK